MVRAAALVFVAALNAVAAPAHSQVTRDRVIHPSIGAEASREVGEAMFETSIVTTMPGAAISLGTTVSIGLGSRVTFVAGELYSKQRGRKTLYCGPIELISAIGQVIPMAEFCETEGWFKKKMVSLTPRRVTKVSVENFRQELLYQGKAGSTVKLSYREFTGDLARPAFTQELTFDLTEGPVVGAKGARIEVLEATNTSIRYRLMQPFAAR